MLAAEYPQALLFEEDWSITETDDGDIQSATCTIKTETGTETETDTWLVSRHTDENETSVRVSKNGTTKREYEPLVLSSTETGSHAVQRAMWREIRRIGYDATQTCKYCPVPLTTRIGHGNQLVTDALGKTVHACNMCIDENEHTKHA